MKYNMVKKSWKADSLCSKRFCASLLRKSAQQERKEGRRMRGREKKRFLLLVQNPTFSLTRTEALSKLSGEYHLGSQAAGCAMQWYNILLRPGLIITVIWRQILFPFQVYLFIKDHHPTLKSNDRSHRRRTGLATSSGSTIFSFFDVCAAQNLIGLSMGFAQLQLDNKNIRFLHNKNASTIYVFRSFRLSLPSHRKCTSVSTPSPSCSKETSNKKPA